MTSKSILVVFSVALLVSCFLKVPAEGQSGKGAISGRVVDSGGAVLQGARVELQPGGASGVTSQQGEFTISNLASGEYTVTVTVTNFQQAQQSVTVGSATNPVLHFQLTLASPISVIRRFVADEAEQEALIPSYGRGLIDEVGKVASVVPHAQLAVQWDVASAVFERLERGVPTRFGQTREEMARTFAAAHGKLGMGVPSDVHLQFHLCYGDASHMHSIEPATSRLLVDFTNRLRTEVKRTIELVHMPVPRARTDDAYYEPLADLDLLPETKIALGLVHYTDGVDGTRRRIAVAEKYRAEFAIATECGFGRRDPETIVPLLRIHAELAGLRD